MDAIIATFLAIGICISGIILVTFVMATSGLDGSKIPIDDNKFQHYCKKINTFYRRNNIFLCIKYAKKADAAFSLTDAQAFLKNNIKEETKEFNDGLNKLLKSLDLITFNIAFEMIEADKKDKKKSTIIAGK